MRNNEERETGDFYAYWMQQEHDKSESKQSNNVLRSARVLVRKQKLATNKNGSC